MARVLPEHFFGEEPPERIIGTEMEYAAQKIHQTDEKIKTSIEGSVLADFEAYTDIKTCKAVRGMTLQNGANIHNDMGHIEYAGPECLGPRTATAADHAGIAIMKRLAHVFDMNCAIYRRVGTDFSNDNRDEQHGPSDEEMPERPAPPPDTTGYHENYIIPDGIANKETLGKVLPSFMATRVWAGLGMVGRDGFHLSQKGGGIGVEYVETIANRTTPGKKPMFMIHSSKRGMDKDINPLDGWGRLEVRFADPVQSRAAGFITKAATSLMLRMIEHPGIVGESFDRLCLVDPLNAKKVVDADTSFTALFATIDGKEYTALDLQEQYAELALALSEKIALPDDEVDGAYEWLNIIDDFRRCDFKTHDYAPIMDATDFAPRHRMLLRKLGEEGIHSQNDSAVHKDLWWDCIEPEGTGQKYWDKIGGRQDMVPQEDIDTLIYEPPEGTRAFTRGNFIGNDQAVYVTWINARMESGHNVPLEDPYLEY